MPSLRCSWTSCAPYEIGARPKKNNQLEQHLKLLPVLLVVARV
jgi:hypothetical protein